MGIYFQMIMMMDISNLIKILRNRFCKSENKINVSI